MGKKPEFLVAEFSAAYKTSGAQSSTDCTVYYLAPEVSSVLTSESAASSFLRSYSGRFGGNVEGMDVEAAARLQQYVAREFLTLVQRPIQYAIYKKALNEFAFAFGPQRRLVKRRWYDCTRWFSGDTYRFAYEITPGPRDCYAVIVLPKDARQLEVKGAFRDAPLVSRAISQVAQEAMSPARSATMWKFDVTEKPKPKTPVPSPIQPSEMYPHIKNTLYITTTEPVSAESEVLIGHVGLPQDQVTVLGRYLLKVVVAPDEGLQARITDGGSVEVHVATPGYGVRSVGTVKLKKAEAKKKAAQAEITPDKGRAKEQVQIAIKDLDMTAVTAVVFGGVMVTNFQAKSKDKLILAVPDLVPGNAAPVVRVWVQYTKAGKAQRHLIREPFVYLDRPAS
jgi:hypothetical protein